jgi:hypothetical protein
MAKAKKETMVWKLARLTPTGWYDDGVEPPRYYEGGGRATTTCCAERGSDVASVKSPLRFDTRPIPLSVKLKGPSLNLGLPDNHVRHLFEGCIGCGGSTEGHPWDGSLKFDSGDSLGLVPFVAWLRSVGAVELELTP